MPTVTEKGVCVSFRTPSPQGQDDRASEMGESQQPWRLAQEGHRPHLFICKQGGLGNMRKTGAVDVCRCGLSYSI